MGEKLFVHVHQLGAALVDHTGQIGDKNVFAWNTQLHQQPQAGQRCGTGAGGHQLDLLGVFADHLQAVEDGCAHHNSGAMLVVMEDGNIHAFAQFAFDIKAVWRFDVFEVDATKGRLQRRDDVDQLVQVVFFVDLNVKNVDAGKLLEQNALAFHHRLSSERANIAQAQHGRAVGDHRHQVAAAGVLKGVVRVFDNFFAGRRDAG